MAIKKNPVFAQASDWSFALAGTHIAVYLLYGHPTCNWRCILKMLPTKFQEQRSIPAQQQQL
eukprot:2665506-Prorocentrum_lima.AAC.1